MTVPAAESDPGQHTNATVPTSSRRRLIGLVTGCAAAVIAAAVIVYATQTSQKPARIDSGITACRQVADTGPPTASSDALNRSIRANFAASSYADLRGPGTAWLDDTINLPQVMATSSVQGEATFFATISEELDATYAGCTARGVTIDPVDTPTTTPPANDVCTSAGKHLTASQSEQLTTDTEQLTSDCV